VRIWSGRKTGNQSDEKCSDNNRELHAVTMPEPRNSQVSMREIGGKDGAVGQVGFGPHRNKPL